MLSVIFRGHDEIGFFGFALGLGPGASPLCVLPNNQRTSSARYACLIIVKDYARMSVESRDDGVWHYSCIEPEILCDVRAGRAILVFDLSNEGPPYDASIFGVLFNWIERNQLPAGRCIWLSQNRMLAAAAAEDVGQRGALVQFEHYDYFIKRIAWRFSPSGGGDILGADPLGYVERLVTSACKDKLLLSLNATPRLGRVLTVAALHHYHLLNNSLVSFPGMRYVKTGTSFPDILRFLDGHPNLTDLRSSIHAVTRMAPLRVDSFREQGNDLVEKIDHRVYERTFLSLVTESDFGVPGITRVTEKTVKAFCMGHPTLVVGNAHSIDAMKGLGFEDWSEVIDRTHESIACPATRFESVFMELLRQTHRIHFDPKGWLNAVRNISERNHQYAVKGDFLANYANTVDRPLVARLKTLIAA